MRPAALAATLVAAVAPAYGSNSRRVDVTVTYDRTVRRAVTSEFTGECAISNVSKTSMTITGQLVFKGVELVDNAARISLTLPAHTKATGTAELRVTDEVHQTTCTAKSDGSGEASSTAKASAVHVDLDVDKKTGLGSLAIAADFPTAKATGTLTTTDKAGTRTQDATLSVGGAAATLVGSMGAITLQTKASEDALPPAWPAVYMKGLAQDLPFTVDRSGDEVDLIYTNEHTTDLATEPPASTAHDKHGGTLEVTTELHIHIAPAAK